MLYRPEYNDYKYEYVIINNDEYFVNKLLLGFAA